MPSSKAPGPYGRRSAVGVRVVIGVLVFLVIALLMFMFDNRWPLLLVVVTTGMVAWWEQRWRDRQKSG
jgi:hypothetical protein